MLEELGQPDPNALERNFELNDEEFKEFSERIRNKIKEQNATA